MKLSFLLLYALISIIFLFITCQKAYDPLSTNPTIKYNNLTTGSNWKYSYSEGTSITDTFTLTVINRDTVINGKTYKVLTSSNGTANNYLSNIDNIHYRYPSFAQKGLEPFEELYLKDNLPIYSTWTNTTTFFNNELYPSLRGNWKMDEGSGTILRDVSNYRNNATTTGNPLWEAGVTGQALKFNGDNQYASVPSNASLNLTKAITLAAWIKPEKQATQYILKKAIIGLTNGYELSLSANGLVFFRFNQASSANTFRLNSTGAYPSDGFTWMHIAATYDGAEAKLYLNGVENSSTTLINAPRIDSNQLALAIGAESDGATQFKGTIDDVRIYNAALNPSQIRNFIYSNVPDTLTANLTYTVQEKNISYEVKGNTYNNVTHIRLNITLDSSLNIGGGDFYYASGIGLIKNNIEIASPGHSSITSQQELIAYDIK